MYYIKETRSLHANHKLALEVILNVDQYHLFLPWCVHSKIISRDENLFEADLTIKYSGIQKIFRSVINYNVVENNFVIISKSNSDIFKLLETKWEIITKLHLTEIRCLVKIDFSSSIFNFMFRFLQNLIKQKLIDAFIKRIIYLQQLNSNQGFNDKLLK